MQCVVPKAINKILDLEVVRRLEGEFPRFHSYGLRVQVSPAGDTDSGSYQGE